VPTAPDQGQSLLDLPGRSKAAILGAVMLGLFLASLDQTVVGTALPRITTDLNGSADYTWVVTAYLLTSTITVPIYGKLSDVYGRKPALLAGITLFLIGSVLSGQSRDILQLIVFRAVQGLGAGSLFPISLAIIGDLFTPRERGRYQGVFGGVFGIAFILGPFVGGALTDGPGWRWVFYVNLPIGIAAMVIVAAVLPIVRKATTPVRDLDFLGVAVFAAGVVPLLLGLNNEGQTEASGNSPSWFDPHVGGFILLAAALLALFVYIESRAKEPIIPLSLFRNRTYTAATLATLAVSFALFATIIFLPRFFQVVRGDSATRSGYESWPLLLGLIGASIGGGQIISRTGKFKRLLIGSTTLLIAGTALLTTMQTDTPTPVLWGFMALAGLGVGPAMSAFTTVVQSVAPMNLLGAATSSLTFIRQIGGSIGLAIAGAVFGQTFNTDLPSRLVAAGVPSRIAAGIHGGQLTGVGSQALGGLARRSPALVHAVTQGVHNAFTAGIAATFWVSLGGAVLAMLAIWWMPEVPLRGRAATATTVESAAA